MYIEYSIISFILVRCVNSGSLFTTIQYYLHYDIRSRSMWWFLALAGFLVPLFSVSAGNDNNPIVNTPLGRVRGFKMSSRGGREFQAFTAIPYAKPPVGMLRFQPPKPVDPWKGLKDATGGVPYCLTMDTFSPEPKAIGVEDCLVVSVFTHNVSGRAPVIVHIHGGGFIVGNADVKPLYLMDEDLVIVDVNYRLGILGFLSFEDEEMPGNQGLKDQSLALRWVQENIASFGGNPDCVTIAGESAGGYSVYHHTVSPLSRGLFHRAIAESGTSYDIGSLMPPGYVRNNAMRLAKYMDCEGNTTQEIVTCLRNADPKELASQLVKYRVWQVDPLSTFRPVLEPPGPGAFLTGKVSDWDHAPVPLLTGVTAAEGLLRALYFITMDMDFNWYNDHFNEVTPSTLGYLATSSEPDEVTKKVKEFYLPKNNISFIDWYKIVQMHSDATFTVGAIMGADNHKGKVYFYFFNYLGEYTLAGKHNRSVVVGAYHMDEMIYLWCLPPYDKLKGPDLKLSNNLVKMWSRFAATGNPTLVNGDIIWDNWSVERHNYLHISDKGFTMEENFLQDRYNFWSTLNYRDKLM
uniref:Carboxylic ester hydrolase n=1 Tax=Riptortus pedestris TaxID=329032 RepID=R4WDE3_RIPPE|nr:hypothetical protein [Riptortus pedestris]